MSIRYAGDGMSIVEPARVYGCLRLWANTTTLGAILVNNFIKHHKT